MTNSDRIRYALEIASQGKFAEARNILLLANADEKAWSKFSKMWVKSLQTRDWSIKQGA